MARDLDPRTMSFEPEGMVEVRLLVPQGLDKDGIAAAAVDIGDGSQGEYLFLVRWHPMDTSKAELHVWINEPGEGARHWFRVYLDATPALMMFYRLVGLAATDGFGENPFGAGTYAEEALR